MSLFLFSSFSLYSQELEEEIWEDDVILSDSLESINIDSLIAATPTKNNIEIEFTKSPMGALYRSAIPGWGQLYVEHYWKAPLVFGAAATFTGLIFYYHSNYRTAAIEADALINPYRNNTPYSGVNQHNNRPVNFTFDRTELDRVKRRREFNRDLRDRNGFFLLTIYIIGAIDAYTGAHLYDFNVDDDLSIMFAPNINGGVSLVFNYSW